MSFQALLIPPFRTFRLKKHVACFSVAFVSLMFCAGCKKLVQVSAPDTYINTQNAFQTDATAISVLNGIYTQMNQGTFQLGNPTLPILSFLPGLSADELTLYQGVNDVSLIGYFTNAINPTDNIYDFWSGLYPIIYQCNTAIEGLNAATRLTPAIKQQLLGEALFSRAFCYFYLVNLYGDVPLAITSDYKTNALLPRTAQAKVWAQIITDATTSQQLLSQQFLDVSLKNPTAERTRPTQWAANALLARAYLYTQKWDSAANAASLIINNNNTFSLDSLNNIFLMNSTEAIWQLQPVLPGYNTVEAPVFVLPSGGPNSSTNPLYLNPTLVSAFEPGDERKITWVDSVSDSLNGSVMTYYYPIKYQVSALNAPVSEYEMVFRLAEQYLIRAESEAENMDLTNAANDLNVIRHRAGLQNTTAASQPDLLNAILHERQVELFTEWGQRWLDLKRSGAIDAVMTVQCGLKGGTWNDNAKYYPVPLSELSADPNLVQTPGY